MSNTFFFVAKSYTNVYKCWNGDKPSVFERFSSDGRLHEIKLPTSIMMHPSLQIRLGHITPMHQSPRINQYLLTELVDRAKDVYPNARFNTVKLTKDITNEFVQVKLKRQICGVTVSEKVTNVGLSGAFPSTATPVEQQYALFHRAATDKAILHLNNLTSAHENLGLVNIRNTFKQTYAESFARDYASFQTQPAPETERNMDSYNAVYWQTHANALVYADALSQSGTVAQNLENFSRRQPFSDLPDHIALHGQANISVQQPGQEASVIIDFIRKMPPNTPMMIRYQNQPGIDHGALKRDCISKAYEQVLSPSWGLVDKPRNSGPATFSANASSQSLWEFGHLLALISKTKDLAVPPKLGEQFFDDLHNACRAYNRAQAWSCQSEPLKIESFIETTTDKNILRQVLEDAIGFEAVKKIADPQALDFDAELDLDTLKEYLSYRLNELIIAQGFMQQLQQLPDNIKDFKDSIIGALDLKQELQDIMVEDKTPTGLISQSKKERVTQWLNRFVNGKDNATDQEKQAHQQLLRQFCQYATGSKSLSPGLGKAIKVELQGIPKQIFETQVDGLIQQHKHEVFAKSQACFNTLTLNVNALPTGDADESYEEFFNLLSAAIAEGDAGFNIS